MSTSGAPTAAKSEHRIIAAGFGGQGVLTIGKLLANAAMAEDRPVSYLPSYGAEVRGGTANCQITISDHPIYNPMVETADSLLILNELSMERFLPCLAPGGLLVANTSAVDLDAFELSEPGDVLPVPAIQAAAELGEVRVANVVMLGAFAARSGVVSLDSCAEAVRKVLGTRKAALLDVNLQALARGAEIAQTT